MEGAVLKPGMDQPRVPVWCPQRQRCETEDWKGRIAGAWQAWLPRDLTHIIFKACLFLIALLLRPPPSQGLSSY